MASKYKNYYIFGGKNMKNFFKILALVLVFAMTAVMFVACDKDNNDQGGGTNTPPASSDTAGDSSPTDQPKPETPAQNVDKTVSEASLKNLVGSGNLYVTAIGLGSAVTVEALLEEIGWTPGTAPAANVYVVNNELTKNDVKAGDTVLVILGTSGKGLGDAGVSVADEIARATALVARKDINIIAIHTGKQPYRGESSDPIIEVVAPAADVVLVIDGGDGKGGNYDGLFTTLCGENVPLYVFSKAGKMVASMEYLLNA